MGSFFRALFDFSFSEFITSKIIKVLYVIMIVLVALFWIAVLIYSFMMPGKNAFSIIASIIIVPIAFLLHIIFMRVGYEILIVIFGIAEHTRDIAWALTGGRKAPSATPPQPPQYAQPQYAQQAPQQYPQYPPQGGQLPQQQPPQNPQYPQYPPQPK
jgi:hypothetical protein